MSKSTKYGFTALFKEAAFLVVPLIAAAFIWDTSHPMAAAPRITQTPAVHTQELAIPVIHHYTSKTCEAMMLAAPARTGYLMSNIDESAEAINLAEVEVKDPLKDGYEHLMKYTTVSSQGQAALNSMGLTTSQDDTVMLLAKLIASEAGPNKLDQLMVASVVLNHVYSDEFPSIHSLIDAIIAPRHYACWPYMVMNRTPSDEMIASAKQVLSGEFPVPANIIFQAGFWQGTGGVFMTVNNKQYGNFYNNYYCYNNSLCETDRYGNAAMSEAELVELAEILHQSDIENGFVSVEA